MLVTITLLLTIISVLGCLAAVWFAPLAASGWQMRTIFTVPTLLNSCSMLSIEWSSGRFSATTVRAYSTQKNASKLSIVNIFSLHVDQISNSGVDRMHSYHYILKL